jgi:HEAT repeat protein
MGGRVVKLRIRWTRRRVVLATLAALLAAGGLAAREWSLVNRLPMEVRHRMPWHCRIPSGLDPEVRAGIEGLYSPLAYDRIQAADDLAGIGSRAAPAVPHLVALLADAPVPEANNRDKPTPLFSAWRDKPIIGRIVRFFSWGPPEGDDSECSYASAREALSEIGPAAVDPLIAALRDDSADVRQGAAMALGNIADERAIDPLAAAMNDPRGGRPSATAAVALAQFRDERVVRHLRDALIRTGRPADDYLQTAVVRALGLMGPLGLAPLTEGAGMDSPAGTQSIWWISQYVHDCKKTADPDRRKAVEALAAAVTGPDENRDFPAIWGLSGCGEPAAVDALVATTRHPSLDVRRTALAALASSGGPKAVEVHTALLADPDLKLTATMGLARMGDPEALRALYDRLLDPKDKDTGYIQPTISYSYRPQTAGVLREMLDGLFEADLFDAVARAFYGRHDAQALPILISHARSWPKTEVLKSVLISYGPEAVPALVASLREPGENRLVLSVLGELKDPRAVEPLLAMLADPDREPHIDADIIWVLGRIGDGRALAPLAEMLKHGGENGMAAAKALGRLGDKRAVPVLRAAMADPGIVPPQAPANPDGIRAEILQALLRLDDAEAIEPAFHEEFSLGSMAEDFASYRRMGPAAAAPLARLMHEADPKSERNWPTYSTTVLGLLFVGTPEALAEIRPVFAWNQDYIFCSTLLNIYDGRDKIRPPTESLLALLAEHKDRHTRCAAARLLADDKDPRVVPALRAAAASDACTSVRIAAWDAIEKLTGEVRPASVPPRWLDDRTLADIPQPPAPTAAGGGLFTVPTQTTGGTP